MCIRDRASGVVNYLSSDKFPGIGKRTAEKIVEVLGESAIDRIIDDPSVLEEVTVLNEKKRQVIVETIRLNHGMEQVIVGLNLSLIHIWIYHGTRVGAVFSAI